MMECIHWKKIWEEMEKKDPLGRPVPFSLTFVKKSTGALVKVASCTLTSFHSAGTTLNIKYDGEITPRTIRKCLILEFNGKQVYL